jgi:hypothetical protein
MGNRQTGVSRAYAIRIEGVTGIPQEHFIDHRSSRGRVVRLQEAEVGLRWADDLEGAVEVLIELWRCRLDRREFLVAVAATAVTSEVALRWLVSPPDGRVERDAGSRCVGDSDIEAVRAMQASLKAIDDAHGGGVVLPMAVDYLRGEVAPLLGGRYRDAVGRALFSATAEFTLGVGWMAYDAGKHGLAQRYMAQALRMSHAADDRAFGGRILAAMSHQALHLDDVRHGLDFACAARAGTRGAVTPTTTAMLAAMEACAHAARGDTSPCLRALSDAERAFARSTPAEDPPWVDFDEGGWLGTWPAASATSTSPARLHTSRPSRSSSAARPTCGLASSATRSLPAPTPNRATWRAHVRWVDKRWRRYQGFGRGERWTMWHISCSSSARTTVRRPATSPGRPARYSTAR